MSKIDSKYLQSLKETLDIERMKTQSIMLTPQQ